MCRKTPCFSCGECQELEKCLKSGKILKTQIDSRGEPSVTIFDNVCQISINPDTKNLIQCNMRRRK